MPLIEKSKPWELAAPPSDLKDDSQVYVVELTGEIFKDYEEFSERVLLYKRKIWTCGRTGKSNLTYEAAMHSEKEASEKVPEFPAEFLDLALSIVHGSSRKTDDLAGAIVEFFRTHFVVGDVLHSTSLGKKKVLVKVLTTPKHNVDYIKASEQQASSSSASATTPSSTPLPSPMPTSEAAATTTPSENSPIPTSTEKSEKASDQPQKTAEKPKKEKAAPPPVDPAAGELTYHVKVLEGEQKGQDVDIKGKDLSRQHKFFLTKASTAVWVRSVAAKSAKTANVWALHNAEDVKRLGLKEITPPEQDRPKKRKKSEAGAAEGDSGEGSSNKKEEGGKEKKKQKTEEKKEKIKYPIEDSAVPRGGAEDPHHDSKRPAPLTATRLPQPALADLFFVWDFLNTFGKPLKLSPIPFEEFEDTVVSADDVPLTSEPHKRLIHLLLSEELEGGGNVSKPPQQSNKKEKSKKKEKNEDDSDEEGEEEEQQEEVEDLEQFIERINKMVDSATGAVGVRTRRSSSKAAAEKPDPNKQGQRGIDRLAAQRGDQWVTILREFLDRSLFFKKSPAAVDGASIEQSWDTNGYFSLEPSERLAVLRYLCQCAESTSAVRDHLTTCVDKCEELRKQLWKDNAEESKRHKTALSQIQSKKDKLVQALEALTAAREKEGVDVKEAKGVLEQARSAEKQNNEPEQDGETDSVEGLGAGAVDSDSDGEVNISVELDITLDSQSQMDVDVDEQPTAAASRGGKKSKKPDPMIEKQRALAGLVRQEKHEIKKHELQKHTIKATFDREISKWSIRHAPLGNDRFGNQYWFFPSKIWVTTPPPIPKAPIGTAAESSSGSASGASTSPAASDDPTWGYYDTTDQVDSLLAFLDERGIREKRLIANIRSVRRQVDSAHKKKEKAEALEKKTQQAAATASTSQEGQDDSSPVAESPAPLRRSARAAAIPKKSTPTPTGRGRGRPPAAQASSATAGLKKGQWVNKLA